MQISTTMRILYEGKYFDIDSISEPTSSTKLQIGKLDRRITLQSLTQTQGEYGELIDTWSDVATVWANAYAGAGKEFVAARQVNAEVSMQFQIRYSNRVGRLNIFAKARQV